MDETDLRQAEPHRRGRHFVGSLVMLFGFTCLLLLAIAALVSAVVARHTLSVPLLAATVLMLCTAAAPHLARRRWPHRRAGLLAGSGVLLLLWLVVLTAFNIVTQWPRLPELVVLGGSIVGLLGGALVSGLHRREAPSEPPMRGQWLGVNLMLMLALPMALFASWTIPVRSVELLRAAQSGDEAGIARGLTGLFVPVDPVDRDGHTPLHRAAANGHTAVIALLLARGADIDATDPDGRTPLYLAAASGRRAAVEMLLARGADRDIKDHTDTTARQAALRNHHADTAELLGQ